MLNISSNLSKCNHSFVAGIDVGSMATKVVVVDASNKAIIATHIVPTGFEPHKAAKQALEQACAMAQITIEQLQSIVGTGYGRISLPFAHKTLTEISCHAKAAVFVCPTASMVLDIGGQDSKAIKVLPDASVLDFVMNDKCAAGTGRFLQVLAGILNMSLVELGEAAARGQAVPISSMCAVFAESEIVGLLAKGTKPEDVAAGVFVSIAKRMRGLSGRMGLATDQGVCVFSGGLATNPAFVDCLAHELGKDIFVHEYAQCMGALGAALFAAQMI